MSFVKLGLIWYLISCMIFITTVWSQKTSTKDTPVTTQIEEKSASILKTDDFRLPPHLVPVHYLVRLQPFIIGNFSFHGHIEITFTVEQPTNKIILHIRDIITRNHTAEITEENDQSSEEVDIKVVNQEYDPRREFYTATFSHVLKKGKTYLFMIDYEGLLNDKLDGFYRSSYVDQNGIKRWLAATQFQPTDGRMAFPCFDEPALKATFSIEMIRPDNMSSISNMPKEETIQDIDQEGWSMDIFQKSVKMSTYLVAFMVSDFVSISADIHNETSISVWTRREAIQHADYSLEIGRKILLFFENYFNISFPLPKTDMVALPDFSAGAMENWGLVNYREVYLMYDPEITSAASKHKTVNIIAHELAHQWFGNLVTPYWWTDLWLNEGFATWMADVSHNHVEPSMHALDQTIFKIRYAMNIDSLENSHPISIPVGHPDEISEIFDAISYYKGASILRMITHFLSEETFKKGVTNYLKHYAYSDAKQDDLWHFLTLQAEQDKMLPPGTTVKNIMDTWTLQMGFPIVNVAVNDNGTASLTQERFFKYKNVNVTDSHDYKWWIPITYATESDPCFSRTNVYSWMKPNESHKLISGLPTESQWYVFNNLQTGFYRVNYPIDNWYRIIDQFKNNHSVFPALTRAQIIGDAFNIAKSGLLNYSVPLSLFSNLKYEDDYVPMKVALDDSGYLRSILKYTDLEWNIKNFSLNLISRHYDHVGFSDQPLDSHLDKLKRALLIPYACVWESPSCVESASQLFQEWMLDPTNTSLISPNLQELVYCNGIKYGGQEEWQFAWKQYNLSTVDSEKNKIMKAFGCTTNDTLKAEFLDLIFKENSPIRKQDASTAFSSLDVDRKGSMMAWTYLQEKFDEIREYISSKTRAIRLIKIASSNVKNRENLSQFDSFIESKKELRGTGTRSLNQIRENIVGNIEWLEDNFEDIGTILSKENIRTFLF